ncbi:MAG: hypothetical protein WCY19_02750 [Candidatus Gastranaerophilaceae bacterium]
MEDKFFDIDEMMVDYSEMTSFDFNSGSYLAVSGEKLGSQEYSHQPYTFKYGNYDVLDMLKSMFSKVSFQKG